MDLDSLCYSVNFQGSEAILSDVFMRRARIEIRRAVEQDSMVRASYQKQAQQPRRQTAGLRKYQTSSITAAASENTVVRRQARYSRRRWRSVYRSQEEQVIVTVHSITCIQVRRYLGAARLGSAATVSSFELDTHYSMHTSCTV